MQGPIVAEEYDLLISFQVSPKPLSPDTISEGVLNPPRFYEISKLCLNLSPQEKYDKNVTTVEFSLLFAIIHEPLTQRVICTKGIEEIDCKNMLTKL